MITVIDAPMGTGKTEFAIQEMNRLIAEGIPFIFCTPFIKEIDRVKNRLPVDSCDVGREGQKLQDLNRSILNNRNVLCTHNCLKLADTETLAYMANSDYVLFLDEVMDVVEIVPCVPADIKALLQNFVTVSEDGLVTWIETAEPYTGNFYELMKKIKTGRVRLIAEKMLIWEFPIDLFKSARSTYILTYMFSVSMQRYYYDKYGINYKYSEIACVRRGDNFEDNEYKLIPYDNKTHTNDSVRSKITIIEDKALNKVGDRKTACSKAWYQKNSAGFKKLKANIANIRRWKWKDKRILWTAFNDYKDKIAEKCISKADYIPCNCRATNDYKDRDCMIYAVNRYMNPLIKNHYFAGIEIDEDGVALSEMLQCIWRSAIRDGKPIQLYIPSKRMRELLQDYLCQP